MAFGPKKKHSKHRSRQRTTIYKGEQIVAVKKSKQKVTRV